MMNKAIPSLLLIALAVCTAPSADAAEFGGIREANLYPFIQQFTWEEFSNGSKLLKESGPQYGVGGDISIALLRGDAGDLTVRGKQELFGGNVNYDGQLNDGTPHSTDVNYLGTLSEVDLGWAFPVLNVMVEPYAGLSYRWWQRDLQGSYGYVEQWSSASVLLGIRSQHELAQDAQFFVAGAAKYPFYNRNNVDFPGIGEVELSPGSEWSVVADSGIRYRNVYAAIYYENYIFPKSSVEHGLYQPRSESQIYGLRVGWAFR